MSLLKKMRIFNYFVFCILAFQVVSTNRPRMKSRISSRMRIVGGPFVRRGQIKYVVVTLHDDEYYVCGGAIIDDYYILSAAHCFINDENEFADDKITVVTRIVDYNDKSDPNRIEVDVEKVYVHEGYKNGNKNDIAVLKLKNSLNITKNQLEKLSLPTKSLNLTGKIALMAGFGDDKHRTFMNENNEWDEEGSSSGRLRKAYILLYSNRNCKKQYPNDKIYKTNLCGKMVNENEEKEYGICDGDSGSPLVLIFKQPKVVVGVASWSYGCDERRVPMVYTRVHKYLDFITEVQNDTAKNARVKVFE